VPFDFEAISTHNGWAIAFVGVTIVFTGLICLSVIISQLHKLVIFWESKGKALLTLRLKKRQPALLSGLPPLVQETARHFRTLIPIIGQPFALEDFRSLAAQRGIEVPEYNINRLIQEGFLVENREGNFIWVDEKRG